MVRANGRVDRPERSLLRFRLADSDLRPGDTIVVPVNSSYRDPSGFLDKHYPGGVSNRYRYRSGVEELDHG